MPVQSVTMNPAQPSRTPASQRIQEVGGAFSDMIHRMDSQEAFMDRIVKQALRGKDFSPGELIAIQAGVYRYTQQLEAFSKLVDRTTGALTRTLESGG